MKPKVIVYGLGKYFDKWIKEIEKYYTIVGYCDQRSMFAEVYEKYVSPDLLKGEEFDYVLITSIHHREILADLLHKYNVNSDKILIWEENKRAMDYQNVYGTKVAFGQFGEDYVIAALLCEKGIERKDANYIEVGVNNPFIANNTYFLHLSGAKGILVEANPDSIELIQHCRKNQIVLNRVISEEKGKVPFYIAKEPSVSSLNAENIKRNHSEIEREEMIESITMNEVLNMQSETAVLSLDLEGYDLVALKSIDFTKHHPQIICIETGSVSEELVDYMKKQGYQLAFCNYVNSIWK